MNQKFPDFLKGDYPTNKTGVFSLLVFNDISKYAPGTGDEPIIVQADVNKLDLLIQAKYGERYLSDFFADLDIETRADHTPTPQQTALAAQVSNSLVLIFKEKWQRILNALRMEYGVLDNTAADVSRTTTINRQGIVGDSGSITHGLKVDHDFDVGGIKIDRSTSSTHSITSSDSATVSRSGFNSGSTVPVESETGSGSGTNDIATTSDTETRTGGESTTNSGTDQTSNTRTDNSTETVTETERRVGNIGVTSNIDLLSQEVDFRIRNTFYDIVIDDVVNYFTIPIY